MLGETPIYELPAFRELKAALEEEWPQRNAALFASGTPLNDDPAPDPKPDPKPGEPEPEPKSDPADPPWGDEFDAERAWNTIKTQRERERALEREKQELSGQLQSYKDAEKSDLERAEEARVSMEQRATSAEAAALRLDVALDKAPDGMPVSQIRKLAKRLTGATREEIEADAEELFADFVPEPEQEPEPGARPRPRLRAGAAPSAEPEENDPAKLAAQVPRRYGR